MEELSAAQEKTPLLGNHHHIKPLIPSWPCRTTKAKIDTICVKCGHLLETHWDGVIRGKGFHGSLNAYCTRIKYAYLMDSVPLMTLYTVCINCCGEMGLERDPDIGLTYDYRHNKTRNQEIMIALGYKEVEEIVSSKVIILEGALFNANTVQTVGKDGQLGKWELWNPKQNLED
jgi:hypothetical protein